MHTHLMIHAGKNGITLMVEAAPEWVTIGYGHTESDPTLKATIAVCYDAGQRSLIEECAKTLTARKQRPSVAIFEDTIQVSMSVSPLPHTLSSRLKNNAFIAEAVDSVRSVYVTSCATAFVGDDEFKVFERLRRRDGMFHLLLVDIPRIGNTGGSAMPYAKFMLNAVHTSLQSPI